MLFPHPLLVPLALVAPIQKLPTPAPTIHLADLDGDGVDEALVIGPRGEVTLLANLGEGRFEDVTMASGLASLDFATCALFADFDGDGDLDLFTGSSEHRVWRNMGNASFAATQDSIEHDLVDLCATAVDHDHDGLVDLHLRTEAGDVLYRNAGDARFERIELTEHELAARVVAIANHDDVDDSSRELAPAQRRFRRWLRSTGARTPSSIESNLSGGSWGPPGAPLTANTRCSPEVKDQATGLCVSMSSTPTLGLLYPLSTALNVSPSGRIGAGTTTPSAGLHVENDAGLLATSSGAPSQPIPAQGAGTRMMWYPAKAAFRAGRVTGTSWDDAKVGTESFAGGLATEASGAHSTAFGHGAKARGLNTMAGGMDSVALGDDSVAFGRLSRTLGQASSAFGVRAFADSYASTAFGYYNVGGGDPDNLVFSDPLFEVGNGLGLSNPANALTVLKNGRTGVGTHSPAARLHVVDLATGATASSNSSAVFERNAPNYVSVLGPVGAQKGLVFGDTTGPIRGGFMYDGQTFLSELLQIITAGAMRVAILPTGQVGIATSTPEALLHVRDGSAGQVTANVNSIAVFERDQGGFVSILGPDGSSKGVLFGRASDPDSGGIVYDQASVSDESMQFRTGGNSTKMTILSSGDVGIGTSAPGFKLHVNGSAGKPGGGSWSVASDARLKTEVEDLEGALEALLALRGVTFEYLDPESIGELPGRRTGFIAQEVERVFPDWVETKQDGTKYLSIHGFEALAVEALRDLRAMQEEELATLRREKDAELAELRREIAALRASVRTLARD